MTRGRTGKHGPEKEEMNAKDEEGEVKGLGEVCSACLIIQIIICNHLPPQTKAASAQGQTKASLPTYSLYLQEKSLAPNDRVGCNMIDEIMGDL